MRFGAVGLIAALLAWSGARAEDATQPSHPMFRWPVIGKAQKAEGGGVNIEAPEGEAVHAAADGSVIYAGDELKSYGQLVLIRHADDYVTAYAYLSQTAVQLGANVKRGQIIGKSGKTGEADKPELHFELRKGSVNLNPIGYMSPR